jgi:tryptophan-rich sensory protein
MNPARSGRILLTFVLVGGAAMSFLLDWSPNHLLNPLWHPHARYHSAILLFLFAGIAATATWLLWRPTAEPRTAFTAAALLSLSYWTPFFYVPLLLKPASYWAGIPGHEPHIHGLLVYPNLVVVGLFVALTLLGWRLGTGCQPLTTNKPILSNEIGVADSPPEIS